MPEAIKAAEILREEDIDVEIIDPRSLKPLDEDLLFNSVKKTGRLVIADTGWISGGVSAEISARVCEKAFEYLKKPIKRVALPNVPAPANSILEKEYYPDKNNIVKAVKEIYEI